MLIILGSTGGVGKALLHGMASTMYPYGEIIGSRRSESDLSSSESVDRYFAALAGRLRSNERLHVINAVGISLNGSIAKLHDDAWQQTLDINVMGAVRVLRAFARGTLAIPGSSVCLLSSIVPRVGVYGTAAYSASKAALAGLVKVAGIEFGKRHLRVNAVELGYCHTGLIRQLGAPQLAGVIAGIPLNGLAGEGDIVSACHFALSNRYLTGSMIPLTGGL